MKMVVDKAERIGTKDRDVWKPIGKYGDTANNEKSTRKEWKGKRKITTER